MILLVSCRLRLRGSLQRRCNRSAAAKRARPTLHQVEHHPEGYYPRRRGMYRDRAACSRQASRRCSIRHRGVFLARTACRFRSQEPRTRRFSRYRVLSSQNAESGAGQAGHGGTVFRMNCHCLMLLADYSELSTVPNAKASNFTNSFLLSYQ